MLSLRSASVWVHATSWAVWAVVAFSATSWVLRGAGHDPDGGLRAPPDLPALTVDASATARSLGLVTAGPAAAPTLASRFQLLGVLSGGASQGAALIAVDGKPARPYRVGRVVVDDLVLQSAQDRRVSLGASVQGPATLTLELPAKK